MVKKKNSKFKIKAFPQPPLTKILVLKKKLITTNKQNEITNQNNRMVKKKNSKFKIFGAGEMDLET